MRAAKDLSSIIKPTIERMGYIYWGLQFNGYGRRLMLRIYIDHPDGVTLDDCSAVSDQISGVLDVEDLIRQAYTLEVSSPGIERPLLTKQHYELYIGAMIKVKSYTPFNNRKNFTGHLEKASGNSITLKVAEELIDIPYGAIKQGRLLCAEWDYSKRSASKGDEKQ